MKSEAALSSEAFNIFLRMHPELTISGMDSLTLHIASKERIYAKIAIDHTVRHIYESILIDQGISKKPKKYEEEH